MNVLSLFDGMSCGRIALDRAGIAVDNYFASEINQKAIEVSKKNYKDIIQLGDVKNIKYQDGTLCSDNAEYKVDIDLLIGGSPCQTLSNLGNNTGFEGKSGLFYEYLRILKETNATHFLLENVKMKKEWKDEISKHLMVEPIELNSKLVSAQNRPRLYWSDIKFETPKDKGITISEIIEKDVDLKYYLTPKAKVYITQKDRLKKQLVNLNGNSNNKAITLLARYTGLNGTFLVVDCNGKLDNQKAGTLTARYAKGVSSFGGDSFVYDMDDITVEKIRRFTPTECERLQTVPEGYTEGVADTHRYEMLGNGWTVDIIAEIFKGLHD